jgi:hypothetical protein
MICIDKLLTVGVFTTIQMTPHLFCATGNDIVQCPVMAGQHAGAEALYVIRSIAAEYIRQLDHGALKIVHQFIECLYGQLLGFCGQMCIDTGGFWRAVPQPDLNKP